MEQFSITRSRAGCLNCKQARVKCDQVRPTCGTCARRRHTCRGYQTAKPQLRWQEEETPGSHNSRKRRRESQAPNEFIPSDSPDSPDFKHPTTTSGKANTLSLASTRTSDHDRNTIIAAAGRTTEGLSRNFGNASSLYSCWNPAIIPPGAIRLEDEPTIELYFDRHPVELTIGSQFVEEMNAYTLMVLQHNPEAIGDTLYAIGQIYMDRTGRGSLVPALDRRARTLARLKTKSPSHDLEPIVTMVLGLCAMELIDTKCRPEERALPAMISYVASVIKDHVSLGLGLSSIAKYFVRALARQDMIVSLIYTRRASIHPSVWLDDDASTSPDRLMGYTATLFPLLEELASLAEDVRGSPALRSTVTSAAAETTSGLTGLGSLTYHTPIVISLRNRIAAWYPRISHSLPICSSRRFFVQANSHRSAALLYLYRLFHPPGASGEIDHVAYTMACEIIAYLAVPPEELRLSLWPAFIAAVEMVSEEDRSAAIRIFEDMYSSRKTATALLTRTFCQTRIWRARDSGEDWDWMTLIKRFPGECLPI